MKKALCLFLAISMLLSFAGCEIYTEEDVLDAYEEGYQKGRENQLEDDIFSLEKLQRDIMVNIEQAAVDYSYDYGYLHPEEAVVVIYDYWNGTTEFYHRVPTAEEFEQAVESLINFYGYFYNRKCDDFVFADYIEN